jgi:uncharacterized protein (TIGR02679 family)
MKEREGVQKMKEQFAHPGYRRLFEAAERKWESLERFAGQVQLPNVTDEESRKISGLLGQRVHPGETAIINLATLEKKLLHTRWAVGLEVLVPLVTERPLVSKKQRKGMKVTAWDRFCDKLGQGCLRMESKSWWNGVWEGTVPGSRAVKGAFEESEELASSLASLCIQALDALPCWRDETERLPVFANRLSGDPHIFDADRTAGRWLYQALCAMFGLAAENASEWKREIWQEAGVLLDELSSFVTVAGLQTTSGDRWEAFFATAYAAQMPLLLPLAFFQEKVGLQRVKRVYGVENPAVLHTLLDRWPHYSPLPNMVCTSGQPSVAALKLLDLFAAQGTEIWYSGDFDLKGVEMAGALKKRYGDRFVAWRMGRNEYLAIERGLPFDSNQLRALQEIEVSWDRELVIAMLERREKVFQESLVSMLLSDLVGE